MSDVPKQLQAHAFKPGNTASTKAQRKVFSVRMNEAFQKCLKTKDLQAIAAKMIEQAKGGNLPAAVYVLDRVLGKATQKTDVTLEPLFALRMEVERRISIIPPEQEDKPSG